MSDKNGDSDALRTAYRNFAAREPEDAACKEFRVKKMSVPAAERIIRVYKKAPRFQKMLLMSQGGCGCSTVLQQITENREQRKRRHILFFSLGDEINLGDAEAPDILFGIYSRILRSMPAFDFDPPLRDFRELTEPLLTESGIRERDMDMTARVSFRFRTDHGFRKKLRARLKSGEDILRRSLEKICRQFSRTTRDCFLLSDTVFDRLREEEVSDNILLKLEDMKDREYKSEIRFLKSLEKRIGEVQLLHYKERILKKAWTEEAVDLLILADDTDKLSPRCAEKIFLEESAYLAEPDAEILYTAPLHLMYSPLFSHIKKNFVIETLRPLPISHADGNPDIRAVALLKKMIEKRMPNIFSAETADYLIRRSGGVAGDLTSLIRACCRIALSEKSREIDRRIAEIAVKDAADHCMRFFDAEEYGDTVNRIIRDKNSKGIGSKTLGWLLKYAFILEYRSPDDSSTAMQTDAHPRLKEALNRI
ncbi:MAG: hypothetical protein V2I97_11910 [Desulfococcaceae bacterium]|nr:hypothetical protein [Desulfococcaceae bacterium]